MHESPSPAATITNQETLDISPSRRRLGQRCHAPGCHTLVIFGSLCEACVTQTAIDLAQRFESELIARGFEPGSADLRAVLAGSGSARSLLWYQRETPLGPVGYRDACELRERTETACFLVALDGVRALAHMNGNPTFREALASYTGFHPLDDPMRGALHAADAPPAPASEFTGSIVASARSPRGSYGRTGIPEPGVVDRIAAETESRSGRVFLEDTDPGGARMAGFFGKLPRTHAGLLDRPEHRFDAYTLAVLVVAFYLLLHMPG